MHLMFLNFSAQKNNDFWIKRTPNQYNLLLCIISNYFSIFLQNFQLIMDRVYKKNLIIDEMEEKTLFKIAMITSLVGLLVMIIMIGAIDISESGISSINKTYIGKEIKIKGILTSKKELSGITIMNVKDDTGSIKVIAYKDNNQYLKLEKDSTIEVKGLVKEYGSELEIEADSINLF